MNHRIFERTLRPLVFRGACLFERHFNPQACLVLGPAVQGSSLKSVAVLSGSKRSKFSRYGALVDTRPEPPIF